MSRKSRVSSGNVPTDLDDTAGIKTVRKIRRTLSKNLRNIDQVEDRTERIAVAAYYKAEKRGFKNGYETQDWLEAEATIDKHHNITNQ